MESPNHSPFELPLTVAELNRPYVSSTLHRNARAQYGQFFTPAPVAAFMASMFGETKERDIRLLDAGAGIGALTAAFVQHAVCSDSKPRSIAVDLFEIDRKLDIKLSEVISSCAALCEQSGVRFQAHIHEADFILTAVSMLDSPLFHSPSTYTHIVLNPPYAKLASDSLHRTALRRCGIETTNLYTAFIALAIQLLEVDGELVAITPRSFCNGSYFLPFRKQFTEAMGFTRLHVFDSRDTTFGEDNVLQENLIFHAVRTNTSPDVVITTSNGPQDMDLTSWQRVNATEVIDPTNRDLFIHIPVDRMAQDATQQIRLFDSNLSALGLSVSTGRVVEFRSAEFLRKDLVPESVPLIYPNHFRPDGWIEWPRLGTRKFNAIIKNEETSSHLVPNGNYVVIKRFSPKEEPRRISAAVYDAVRIAATEVAFENHLNVIHAKNTGIPIALAKGLAVYLNSTVLDIYFRQFSGHTQVNSGDLRSLPFPNMETLVRLGNTISNSLPSQLVIDQLIAEEIAKLSDSTQNDIANVRQRLEEAKAVLTALDMPKAQVNDRSALTLLALLGLEPDQQWAMARAPLMGTTPIMDFAALHYVALHQLVRGW